MSVSGSQTTRIGASLAGVGIKLTILAKTEALLWDEIDSSQTASWTHSAVSQSPGWTHSGVSQSPGWVEVET